MDNVALLFCPKRDDAIKAPEKFTHLKRRYNHV